MRRLNGPGAVLLTSLVIVSTPGAAFASARIDKTIWLRQGTPINAASRAGGTCPVPADKDGWHFTLGDAPSRITFKSVTVTFDVGGTQTVGAQGRDAYVASERGANLTRATAVVDGSLFSLPLVRYFDLANTCPGQAPPPPAQPAPQPVPPAPGDQPAPADEPQGQPDQGNGSGDGSGTTGNAQKPKPGATTASANPTVTPTATAALPKIPDGVDQPELQVNEDGSTPVVAVSADEPSGGLGIQGFALIAAGAFLLIFGAAATYVNLRRRGA